MKVRPAFLILLAGALLGTRAADVHASGEDARSSCVELSATVSTSPPSITLSWRPLPGSPGLTLYRRNKGDTSWGSGTTVPAGSTAYTDTTVSVSAEYEYRVVKTVQPSVVGFICAGIEAETPDYRGKIILLVDDVTAGALSGEVARLQADLVGDGWTVLRHNVARTMAVTNVKNLVKADYDADPNHVRSLFILGRVPLPFSGNVSPDGHGNRALPTDLYYAELYGTTWTDHIYNQTNWSDANNWNVPGDDKFDVNKLASVPELECGRVDMYNMPAFLPLTETDLLKRYLNKNHAFRQGRVSVQRRGLVYEAWSLNTAVDGWRNFAPFFGPSNVLAQSWWTMSTESYLWSYTAGYGSEEVGPPSSFASRQLLTIFSMRDGSWSVDFDDPDNQLRCVLASSPSALSCSWARGLVTHYFHMGLGETLGYSMRYSHREVGGGPIYNELLGDPTLRLHPVVPPGIVFTEVNGSGGVTVSWEASAEATRGYHLYRAADGTGPFERINSAPIIGTNFTDNAPLAGTSYYMVRAIKLETSASGTYLNLSQGAIARHPTNTCILTVICPYGTALPAAGEQPLPYATGLTASLVDSLVTHGGTQYVCTGWAGTGDVPASGTDTNPPLIFLTRDSTLAWQWTTNYWLDIQAVGSGAVSHVDGWYAAETDLTLVAQPEPGSRFVFWSGSGVPAGCEARHPLVVPMDRPRQITAHFAPWQFAESALPFSASFEQYSHGFFLPGTDGWQAVWVEAAFVSEDADAIAGLTNYTEACGFPLASTKHLRIMELRGEIANHLACPSNQVIWTDLMVRFDPWDDTMGMPTPDAETQWSLYARSDGRLVLWNRDVEHASNRWTVLDHTVQTDRWYRLTIKSDYTTLDAAHGVTYFQVDLDGRTLSSPAAWSTNNGSGVAGGTWFAAAAPNRRLAQLVFIGQGLFEDIVVTASDPRNRLAPRGTPEWWLRLHDLTGDPTEAELSDADGDGLKAWEEFVAGTDPTDDTSCLCFDGVATQAGERLQLDFPSQSNRWYTLEAAESLLSNNWIEIQFALDSNGSLQEGPVWSTGERLTLFVDPQGRQQCFRIRVMR